MKCADWEEWNQFRWNWCVYAYTWMNGKKVYRMWGVADKYTSLMDSRLQSTVIHVDNIQPNQIKNVEKNDCWIFGRNGADKCCVRVCAWAEHVYTYDQIDGVKRDVAAGCCRAVRMGLCDQKSIAKNTTTWFGFHSDGCYHLHAYENSKESWYAGECVRVRASVILTHWIMSTMNNRYNRWCGY